MASPPRSTWKLYNLGEMGFRGRPPRKLEKILIFKKNLTDVYEFYLDFKSQWTVKEFHKARKSLHIILWKFFKNARDVVVLLWKFKEIKVYLIEIGEPINN